MSGFSIQFDDVSLMCNGGRHYGRGFTGLACYANTGELQRLRIGAEVRDEPDLIIEWRDIWGHNDRAPKPGADLIKVGIWRALEAALSHQYAARIRDGMQKERPVA